MDTSLHYLTMANHLLIQKRILEKVKESGLTLGQPKVLDYLKSHDGASQKEIAAGCFIEAGSLTSILNRMEEKGLIVLFYHLKTFVKGDYQPYHHSDIFCQLQQLAEEGSKREGYLFDYAFVKKGVAVLTIKGKYALRG